MSQTDVDARSSALRRTKTDWLNFAGNMLYAVAAGLFVIGFYIDWKHPEMVVIPQFTLADEANSGIFVLALIVVVLGYIAHRIVAFIEEWYREEVDQTQAWQLRLE